MCTWAYCSVTSWKPDNTWSNNDVIMIMMYKLSVPCLATISLSCIDYHSTLLSLPPVNAGGNLSTVTSPYLTPVRVPKKQGIIATHNNKIRPASSSVNTTGVLQFFFFSWLLLLQVHQKRGLQTRELRIGRTEIILSSLAFCLWLFPVTIVLVMVVNSENVYN